MARLGRDAEEVRQRGEADAARALAEQPPREPDGVDDRRGDAPAREPLDLAVEEAQVEARVVGDERRRRRRTRGSRAPRARRVGAPRSASGRMPVSDVTAGGSGAPGSTSVSNASSSSSARTRCAPISQIRDVRGESPVVSRSTTTKCACSSEDVRPGRRGETDRRAPPGEPRVARDDVVEERPRERGRRAARARRGRAPPRPRARARAGPRRARRGGRQRRTRAACGGS